VEPLIAVQDIHKSFGSLAILQGIDLAVHQGETVVILGASGSGKSTLLRCLNLLEIPDRGVIVFRGKRVGSTTVGRRPLYAQRDLMALRQSVGMVFQQFNLFSHLTVEENIMVAQIKALKKSRHDARQTSRKYLEKVGLLAKADAYPNRLSGGQQQRVAIARALAMEPAVMLLDEATSALDPELVGEVLATIKQLREDGMTMIIVTHELGFAYHVANRIVFIDQGVICEQGSPDEVLLSPRQEKTKDFLRGHNTFRLPESAVI